jgi:general secretion pathway protein N
MKWLQNNPLGAAMVAVSGVFALAALVMAIVWALPVSVELADSGSGNAEGAGPLPVSREVGSLGDYNVVNEKPVFNESRTPVIEELEESTLEDGETTTEIKDAPDVRLTGVVITPGIRLASLTPADGKQESVMAHEGESLTGEYLGWEVASVQPRAVVLESRDGQSLELELQVHDTTIKAPPKPVAPATTAQAAANENEQTSAESEEPLSRAEQIRQRIAERREELRLEQEAQKSQSESRPGGRQQVAAPQTQSPDSANYQNAIRALMNKSNNQPATKEKEDG